MPTALVFGASRGLGRALAEEYLKRGWHVIATVRNEGALADLTSAALTIETVDTTDWTAVDTLHDRLVGTPLNLLFVNAAVSGPSTVPIGEVGPEDFAQMMLVNVLAPLRIADRYADLVDATGTVAVMSSSLGSIELNDSGGWEAYRTSKAALDMGLRSIQARRRDERTWLAVDPGWVADRHGWSQRDADDRAEYSEPHRHARGSSRLGWHRVCELQERGASLVISSKTRPAAVDRLAA